ncbi:MAG: hypothetical protein WCH05_08795 [Chlorobiaceae bacterium]
MLSRAEHLRRIVLGLNVPGFVAYAQTIGYNVTSMLPSGAANLFQRVSKGQMSPGDSLSKIGNGLAHASMFAVSSFMESFPFMQLPASLLASGAKGVYSGASTVLCTISGGRLHLPQSTCSSPPEKTPVIETVKITVK